ncbi:MAG: proteasome lid subunit RPN8/RPN11 [Chlamydiales bacterium]|jgi:proteasome lid subunit RPN8/RPN11
MTTTETCLRLPRALAGRITRWAQECYPQEACGLLVGQIGTAGVEVLEVERLTNVERERAHDRYSVDPVEQMGVEQRANARGLSLVGVWHSHPDQAPIPSETDRAAAWEGYSYLIVSSSAETLDTAGDLRSWRLLDDRFEEQRVVIPPATR